MIRRTVLLLIPILASALTSHLTASARDILVEAESFARLGGWVVDQQSMPAMGSPYLLAHGLGVAVEDAVTTVDIQREGRYRIWVRTRDWAARWSRQGSPGRFKVAVNGQPLSTLFGTEGDEWHWQDGGTVTLHRGGNELRLHDLTGFDGRCDAIYITSDTLSAPPSSSEAMARLRQRLTPVGRRAKRVGPYDLVVVGGGIAGCCAAVSAARLGCRVALVQDRPVLGGNNSSEVRVGLSGLVAQQPYPNLGKLLDEVGSVGYWNAHEADEEPDSPRSAQIRRILALHPEKMTHNAGPASNYGDGKKRRLIESHPEIDLYLSTHITDVERRGSRITAVTGQNILTGERLRFEGKLFADCTGDATVGFLAGADFRSGRESRAQSGEPSAPDKAALFRFHHISTDEVFGDLADSGDLFTEQTPYAPSSPYSASKASSDHLVRAWHRTYGLPVLITNCSNNYGPRQFPEKLIPLMILNALAGRSLPVYGDGRQIRDWLHVEDHARALLQVLACGQVGETYNIGGHNEKRNIDVVRAVCAALEKAAPRKPAGVEHYEDLITFVRDRPGHDSRYAIDASKIARTLGWRPLETFETGLEKTVRWYLENQPWWQAILDGSYRCERLGLGGNAQ